MKRIWSASRGKFFGQTVYSVPRKFDLLAIFAVWIVISIFLGIATTLNWNLPITGAVIYLVALIGLSQAVLFRGKDPRLASVISGTLGFVSIVIFLILNFKGGLNQPALVFAFSLLLGAIFGYVVGTCVGGIFLVADFFRKPFVVNRNSEPNL
ncbi:MAG: hypothetical protein AAF939_12165 [Planctomycetota bacterium]